MARGKRGRSGGGRRRVRGRSRDRDPSLCVDFAEERVVLLLYTKPLDQKRD